MHYYRWHKHGHFEITRMMSKNLTKNSAKEKIKFYTRKDPNTGCWIWQGYINENGYGKVRVGGKQYLTHRLSAYAFLDFDLNSPLFACHNCPGGDNSKCCNPDHLWIGTNDQNIKDAKSKGSYLGASRGILNPKAKLKEEDVIKIREMLIRNTPYRKMCGIFGVSKTTISSIKRGKTWRHLN